MTAAAWAKFGEYRVNLAQVSLIERDDDLLRFFNAEGTQFFSRRFESARQADRVLKEIFRFEEVRLLNTRYEGVDPQAEQETSTTT
jgi:hypothetical protein